jgi:hypothetical protein
MLLLLILDMMLTYLLRMETTWFVKKQNMEWSKIKKLVVSNLAINSYQIVLNTIKTVALAINVKIDICK